MIDANEAVIAVEGLNAGYGKLHILHDISLTVEKHQFVSILGPNGSGKSTLLKSIFGLTHIFDGSIRLNGRELVGMRTEQIGQTGVAYVPQRHNVFTSMTIQENLLLALRHLSAAETQTALDQVYALFPLLTKRRSQLAGQLSGGERQMVAVAMAWLTRPKVMLLDEPSAGLAPLVAKQVFEALDQLRERDLTLVVVEQNARTALRWCDYVYILREGHLAFEGTSAACLADEETVKGYLGVGFGSVFNT